LLLILKTAVEHAYSIFKVIFNNTLDTTKYCLIIHPAGDYGNL